MEIERSTVLTCCCGSRCPYCEGCCCSPYCWGRCCCLYWPYCCCHLPCCGHWNIFPQVQEWPLTAAFQVEFCFDHVCCLYSQFLVYFAVIYTIAVWCGLIQVQTYSISSSELVSTWFLRPKNFWVLYVGLASCLAKLIQRKALCVKNFNHIMLLFERTNVNLH